MVVRTRLDCAVGSAALTRQCAQLAAAHAATRNAFGAPLARQPLMAAVLADLALESEAAMATAFCVAATFERCDAEHDAAGAAADAHAFRRLATAVCKYQLCRRAPAVAFEAMEAHGGNGYIEEGPMARLYRQAPLNAIWEGSGNVICLDVVRTLQREPRAGAAFLTTLAAHRGSDARFDALMESIGKTLESVAMHSAADGAFNVRGARHLVERLAVALQVRFFILLFAFISFVCAPHSFVCSPRRTSRCRRTRSSSSATRGRRRRGCTRASPWAASTPCSPGRTVLAPSLSGRGATCSRTRSWSVSL